MPQDKPFAPIDGCVGSRDLSGPGEEFLVRMPENQAEPFKECLLGLPVSSPNLTGTLQASLDSGGVMPCLSS